MRRVVCAIALGAICAAPLSAQVTMTAASTLKDGWVPNCWGDYECVFKNTSDTPAKVVQLTVVWRVNSEIVAGPWDTPIEVDVPPEGEARHSRACFLPQDVYEKAKPGDPTVEITATVKQGEAEHKLPVAFEVPGAQLPEPSKLIKGRYAGLEMMESRFEGWKSARIVLNWMDQCYAAMHELTGYTPRDGKLLVIREVPPIKVWAYSSDPIAMNTLYMPRLVEEADQGVLPFGWVHEVGHVFDLPDVREWYIWDASSCEFQANFKLAYVLERIEDQSFRMNWPGCGGARMEAPGEGKRKYNPMSSRRFIDALFVFGGDEYLADPSRPWTQDALHPFLQRVQIAYGWEPFKAMYRTYKRFHDAGLKPPESAEEKLQIMAAILTHETGVDLVPMFQLWRMPVTQEDIDRAMERYPIVKSEKAEPTPASATAQ